jgi:alkylhydroperoxidase/carboxymuconolactone decarboxylase family protein YurZ
MRRGGSRATVRELEDQLRCLSINDATCLESLLRSSGSCEGVPNLDPRSVALVRIAALVAMDGPAPAFEHATSSAMAAGASAEDVVGVLTASAPIVGAAHVVAAAPRIARALGYDIDARLEGFDDPTP